MAMFDTSNVLANMLSGKSSMGYGRNEFCSFEDLENEIEASDAEVVQEIEEVLESGDSTAEKVEEIEEIIAEETDEVVEAKDEEIAASEEAMEAYHDSLMISMILGNESINLAEAFGCEGFGEAIKGIWEKIVGLFKKVGAAIAAFFRGLYTSLKNRFKGIRSYTKTGVKINKEVIEMITRKKIEIGEHPLSNVAGAADDMSDKVGKYIDAKKGVVGASDEDAESVKKAIESLTSIIKSIGTDFTYETVDKAINMLIGSGTSLLDSLRKELEGALAMDSTQADATADSKREDMTESKKIMKMLSEPGGIAFIFDIPHADLWAKDQFFKDLRTIFSPTEKDKKKWPKGLAIAKSLGFSTDPNKDIMAIKKIGDKMTSFISWSVKKIEEMKNTSLKMDREDEDSGKSADAIKMIVKSAQGIGSAVSKITGKFKTIINIFVMVIKRCSGFSQKSDWQA